MSESGNSFVVNGSSGIKIGSQGALAYTDRTTGNTGLGAFVLNGGTATSVACVAVGAGAAENLTTGNFMTAVGYWAGQFNQSGIYATYVGYYAGQQATGGYNTGVGAEALSGPNQNIPAATGQYNTAVGREALSTFSSASRSTAVGYEACGGAGNYYPISACTYSGTSVTFTITDTGAYVVGMPVLISGVTGFTTNNPNGLWNITAIAGNTFTVSVTNAPTGSYGSGGTALAGSITGNDNVGVGYYALFVNQRGTGNVAVGSNALRAADVGGGNVAIGYASLYSQTSASLNTAVGQNSGYSVTSGQYNTFVGCGTGYTATPANATTTGAYQTSVGYNSGQGSAAQNFYISTIGALSTASGNYGTALGYKASAVAAGSVAIGADSAGGAAAATIANAIALGTANHLVQVSNNTTGGGSASLGSNSPAVTNTAPYTWLKMLAGDGSTVYVPAWK